MCVVWRREEYVYTRRAQSMNINGVSRTCALCNVALSCTMCSSVGCAHVEVEKTCAKGSDFGIESGVFWLLGRVCRKSRACFRKCQSSREREKERKWMRERARAGQPAKRPRTYSPHIFSQHINYVICCMTPECNVITMSLWWRVRKSHRRRQSHIFAMYVFGNILSTYLLVKKNVYKKCMYMGIHTICIYRDYCRRLFSSLCLTYVALNMY